MSSKPDGNQAPHAGHAPQPAAAPEPAHHHGELPFNFGILEKLKRRNVGRVAILYVMVCYLILEPFEMFFHLLELPAWTGRAVVGVMALGLPAVLLFSWVYEVTPEGLRPAAAVDPTRSIARQTGRRLDRAIIALLAVVLAYFVADKFWLSKRALNVPAAAVPGLAPHDPVRQASRAAPEKSIAVLPLIDLSEQHDQGYFADGLTEELIDLLIRGTDLRVPASTSSFYFKGKQVPIAQIAAALSVSYLLEGSVRKAGNTLRVTAQLVRAADGYHLWSQSYDRELKDVFKIQDEIAAAVVEVLKTKLTSPAVVPAVRRAASPEAYEQYLIGRQFLGRTGVANYQRAMEGFRSALALDPQFVAAQVGLAEAEFLLVVELGQLSPERFAQIQARLTHAIALAPDLADGYSERGVELLETPGDLAAAQADLTRALALAPEDSTSLRRYGFLQRCLGNTAEAVRYTTQATQADPLDVFALNHLGLAQLSAGRYPQAVAAFARAQQISPESVVISRGLVVSYLLAGRTDEALHAAEAHPSQAERPALRAMAEFSRGDTTQSHRLLEEYLKTPAAADAYLVASVHAWRHENREAVEWLARAADYQRGDIVCVRSDPLFRPLQQDARFQALMRERGLH